VFGSIFRIWAARFLRVSCRYTWQVILYVGNFSVIGGLCAVCWRFLFMMGVDRVFACSWVLTS